MVKRTFIAAILVVWAVLNLFPLISHPDQAPTTFKVQNTDFDISHLPASIYVHDNIEQYGKVELWNSLMMSGQPFAADRLSGLWYLPYWLTYWQPQPWAFTLLFLLHLLWTGFGLFVLMKVEGMGTVGALFSALTWMGTPRLIGYIGGSQLINVYSLAWMPWLLLAFRQAAEKLDLRRCALAAACMAITMLADLQWAIFAAILAFAYGIVHIQLNRKYLLKIILVTIATSIFVLILTTGMILPMLEFAGYSRREALNLHNPGIFAFEPFSFLGLIFPQYGMFYDLVIYIGIGSLIFGLMGMVRRKWFWVSVVIIGTLISMGSNAFLFPLFVSLPGASWIRVPSRAWFIVAMSMAALAGWGLDGFLESLSAIRLSRRVVMLVMVSAIILSMGNLLWYNRSQLNSRSLPDSPVEKWLESQSGLFRVYTPDFSIPLPSRLQQANGINPLHLLSYANFLGKAAGMDLPGYSVSVPNIYLDQNTPADIVESASHPNAAQLGLLNVKYLVSKLPLRADGIKLIQTFGDTKIYENLLVQPRAWRENGSAEISYWSPDRIELESDGLAGTLVLSEIMYPGWQAWVDGRLVNVETIDGLLRGVELTTGKHQVVFEFRPLTVYAGSTIAIAGWIAFIILMVFKRK